MNEQQAQRLLAKISEAIVETVNEAPNGAPCGPLYMALMHVWPSMTSEQFNTLIEVLISDGKVKRIGHCLYRLCNCEYGHGQACVGPSCAAQCGPRFKPFKHVAAHDQPGDHQQVDDGYTYGNTR